MLRTTQILLLLSLLYGVDGRSKRLRRQVIPSQHIQVHSEDSSVTFDDLINVRSLDSRIELTEKNVNGTIWSARSTIRFDTYDTFANASAEDAESIMNVQNCVFIHGRARESELFIRTNRTSDGHTFINHRLYDQANVSVTDEGVRVQAINARRVVVEGQTWERYIDKSITLTSSLNPETGERELMLITISPQYRLQVFFVGAVIYVEVGDKIVEIDQDFSSLNIYSNRFHVNFSTKDNSTPYDVKLTPDQVMVRCPKENTNLIVQPSGVSVKVDEFAKMQLDRRGGEMTLGGQVMNADNVKVVALSILLDLANNGFIKADTSKSHIQMHTPVQNIGLTAVHHDIRVDGGVPHLVIEAGPACIEVTSSNGIPPGIVLLPPFTVPVDRFVTIGPYQGIGAPYTAEFYRTVNTVTRIEQITKHVPPPPPPPKHVTVIEKSIVVSEPVLSPKVLNSPKGVPSRSNSPIVPPLHPPSSLRENSYVRPILPPVLPPPPPPPVLPTPPPPPPPVLPLLPPPPPPPVLPLLPPPPPPPVLPPLPPPPSPPVLSPLPPPPPPSVLPPPPPPVLPPLPLPPLPPVLPPLPPPPPPPVPPLLPPLPRPIVLTPLSPPPAEVEVVKEKAVISPPSPQHNSYVRPPLPPLSPPVKLEVIKEAVVIPQPPPAPIHNSYVRPSLTSPPVEISVVKESTAIIPPTSPHNSYLRPPPPSTTSSHGRPADLHADLVVEKVTKTDVIVDESSMKKADLKVEVIASTTPTVVDKELAELKRLQEEIKRLKKTREWTSQESSESNDGDQQTETFTYPNGTTIERLINIKRKITTKIINRHKEETDEHGNVINSTKNPAAPIVDVVVVKKP